MMVFIRFPYEHGTPTWIARQSPARYVTVQEWYLRRTLEGYCSALAGMPERSGGELCRLDYGRKFATLDLQYSLTCNIATATYIVSYVVPPPISMNLPRIAMQPSLACKLR